MVNYIITRFSICYFKYKAFNLTNEKQTLNETEYKLKLFDQNRLNFKFFIFENNTLKTIVNQNENNFVWLIYTSNLLPEYYKNKLIELIKPYNFIRLFFINNFNEMTVSINNIVKKKNFTTIRLDDDDGLNENFIKLSNEHYNTKNKNYKIISYPKGIDFIVIDNNIMYRSTCSSVG